MADLLAQEISQTSADSANIIRPVFLMDTNRKDRFKSDTGSEEDGVRSRSRAKATQIALPIAPLYFGLASEFCAGIDTAGSRLRPTSDLVDAHWAKQNIRRGELLFKRLNGTLTLQEKRLLESLQAFAEHKANQIGQQRLRNTRHLPDPPPEMIDIIDAS